MIIETVLLPAVVAAAAALIGCFAVMRRMALAADALSHVALPGIGVAVALHLNPLFGAVALLFFGALLVWALEDRARLATETIVGVLFSGALAIGSLISSGEDLLDALLGRPGALSWPETWFGLAGATAIVVIVLEKRNSLVVALVSPDIARTAGVNVRRLDLIYLLMFALAVALGLRYLGVLLMGSLLIIPAATAKRLSSNLAQMLTTAVLLAVGVTVAGAELAGWMHRESGPIIVTLAASAFVLALFRRPVS
jgi:ABC-type Mn2+/Zn2+ transport system permease subunit